MLDGGTKHRTRNNSDVVEDIVLESGVLLGVGDDLVDAFFGAKACDALSHGDAKVQEFIGAFACADFKPEFLVRAVDIGKQDSTACCVDVAHGEIEHELHRSMSIFAMIVDLHRTHEGVGEDLCGHPGLIFAFAVGK